MKNIPERKSLCWAIGALALTVSLAGCGSPEQRAQQYYESGMALLAKNDDLNARVALLTSAKYKSDRVEVWKALAGIDERTKSNSLFQDLRRIVELDPTDVDAKLRLARIMVAGGAAEPAIKILDGVNEGDKPNAALHAIRALALIRMKDPAGAVREAQRAFEIDPHDIDAVSILASKKLADGDSNGASGMLDALPPAEQAAERLRISQLRFDIFRRVGNFAAAEGIARQLVAEYPQDNNYRMQLVQVLTSERKNDEAEKELRSAVALTPSDNRAQLDLVRFINTFRGADAARTELETQIKAGGNTTDLKIALADLNFANNRQAAAIESLQKLVTETDKSDVKSRIQVRLAEMLIAKGNQAAAEPLISEVLGKDRKNSGALRLRAALSLENGQTDNAIADLREALSDQPQSPPLLLALALAYEQGGKRELADRQYADALKNSNLNPDIALRYVAFLQRTGDVARADDVLTEVAGRNPDNLQILSSLGQVKLSRQNWQGAAAIAKMIAGKKDGRVLSDQIMAASLAGQQRFAESIAALEDAHRAAPADIQPGVSLASAYIRAGRADDAVTLVQDLNKRYPDNAELLVVLGQTKLAQKKDADAIASFQQAIKQQPKDPVGYSALSDYYIRGKNYDAAEATLRSAVKETPQNINLRMSVASLQILKNDDSSAIAEYEAILKDQPRAQPLVVVNNLASLLLDTRTDKESLDRAAALAEGLKGSNVPQFQDTVGWARLKQGDVKSAVSILEAAAAKSPNLAPLRYHLGLAYSAAGQTSRAREELEAAQKIEPDGTPLKANIQNAIKQNP